MNWNFLGRIAENLPRPLARRVFWLCVTFLFAHSLYGAKPDPCHSALRCHRVADILRAKDASQIEDLYEKGCRAAPERIARALQLYSLHQPGAEKSILEAIPRSYKDYFATVEISSSDLYGNKPPDPRLKGWYAQLEAKYNLPQTCVDRTQEDMNQVARLTNLWWKIMIPIVAKNPEYMPRVFGLYTFFGNNNPPVDDEEGFPDLVRKLYHSNPEAFCQEVGQAKFGHVALIDALTTAEDDGASPAQINALLRKRKCGQFGLQKPQHQK